MYTLEEMKENTISKIIPTCAAVEKGYLLFFEWIVIKKALKVYNLVEMK